MKNTLTTLLFFFSLSFIIAQESNFFSVKVVDSVSFEPISFATIRINNTNRGLIADEEGNFRLPQEHLTQNDTLIISSIGFKTNYVSIETLDKASLNILKIAAKVEVLETVTITKSRVKKEASGVLIAEQIITNAIKNIKIHYPKEPFSYLAYYRDYQVFENEYFNLNEGLLEVFDAGFSTHSFLNKENKTALYSYILNKGFEQNSKFSIPYDNKKSKYIENAELPPIGGNELSILQMHDPIRNYEMKNLAFIYNWEADFIKNHDFELVGTTFLNDRPIYEISIKKKVPKNTSINTRFLYVKGNMKFEDNFRAEGTIYISKGNFAIHKIVYAVYEGDSKNSTYAINLEYVPKNNRMYLNYLSFNNTFKVKDDNSFTTTSLNLNDLLDVVYVSFNNPINESTLKKNNFKLYYANVELPIKAVELVEGKANQIKIHIKENTFKKFEMNASSKVDFETKNVLDTSNRTLGQLLFLDVNQFREIFVQEVFPNKKPSKNLEYIDKLSPLSKAHLNKNDAVSKYWLNTPLKTTKN
ncbi:carboxypeptidase-like regulatory domain-containing protein [Mariniflexile gromovii]|uniref:Carboxypeptidase-like regulatory domain-containing protein n=1 Tax=Mariniflexile gromovii TaxID=362523 RepID=A0ABS4BQR5_9FLAO|nr:carboxypeptidase-like regulatory domain-containing protein [Mariniflexile gromovii]MBP0902758.1 carboxypeptidase-like regulatory domain-containing protein [Mariniflexile gromovii]